MQNSDFLQKLINHLGEQNVLTDPAACAPYGEDNSRRHVQPDVVAFATKHEHVAAAVRLCHEYQTPIVARGLGTGTPGGCVPTHGGLVLSLEKMQRIINIDPANRVMVVEPGVINQTVQDEAEKHGFFWPPDPSSAARCTVGGNLAYNAAGPRAVKYGTPRENTLGLRAVTGTGETIHTGVYTTKGVVGYDLTRLIIGSEGTLAIITEATLKLTPLQPIKRTIRAAYRDIHTAAAAVAAIMAQPATPYALEFLDHHSIKMIQAYYAEEKNTTSPLATLPTAAQAVLLIAADGTEHSLVDAIDHIATAGQNAGLIEFIAAQDDAESKAIWEARKALSPALRFVAPKKINEDIAVPVSRIPDLISLLDELANRHQITIVNFGHAGNGNIHVNLMIDPNNPIQVKNAKICLSEMFDTVLKLGGTLSGEHGVGIEKRDFIDREIDPISLALMKQIKKIFDPCGILNPGKIFPE